MPSRESVKAELISLLKEDEEFRYAVSGLIGLQEILMRLEEQGKRLEELSMRLEEQGKRLEELTVSMAEVKVTLGSLGRRWGRDLEKTVLAIYRHALEEKGVEPGRVERFKYRDIDGRYVGKGADVEMDVYIHNEKLYLIEVKSRAEADDVTWLTVKAPIVEKILNRKAEKIILVAVNIDKEAYNLAKQQGIEVVAGTIIE